MKKFFAISFLVIIFSLDSLAQITRSTSFDERPICEKTKGIWREFGNGCANGCASAFDKFVVCTEAIVFGCDCGKARCWNGETCVALKDYKKIYDAEQKKDEKILSEAKKKRHDEAMENQARIMDKFVSQYSSTAQPVALDKDGKPLQGSNNLAQFYNDAVSQVKNLDAMQNNPPKAPEAAPLPAIPPIPMDIPQAIPQVNNAPQAAPQVPPLFLQQEQAKAAAAQAAQDAQKKLPSPLLTKTPAASPNSAIPGLPEIALPQ